MKVRRVFFQGQRERDGGDVLLQEGRPRGDRDALHGAPGHRGTNITFIFSVQASHLLNIA